MGEFTINIEGTPFSLGYTLESGQAFRWSQEGGWWIGVVGPGVVKIRQDGASLVCESSCDSIDSHFVYGYLGLEDDLEHILASIMKDEKVSEAVHSFYGLRIMRQEVWECLLSFSLAQNSNIPRIKGMVSNLCNLLGETVEFEGEKYSLFPTPESLASAGVTQLTACGLGYRARYVMSIAEAVEMGLRNLDELRLHDYARAKELLMEELLGRKTLVGIGPKVADCVLLFSCGKYSAFPIDVWIVKVLAGYYPQLFSGDLRDRLWSVVSGKSSLSVTSYEALSAAVRRYFGEYAGYAQQYLFHNERTQG